MATGPFNFYDSFYEAIGDGTLDLDTDTLKLALFTSSYSPSASGDTAYSGLSGEHANGNGYTTGGQALSSVTWSQSAGTATLDAADVVWTASGGSITARYAVLYSDTASGNDLIGYFLLDDTPDDVTATDGNTLTVQWNASGILTLS